MCTLLSIEEKLYCNIKICFGVVLAVGPMIIYALCEKGTLKEFLVSNKGNVTIDLQDTLYRFGLDIVKGMEYLASKGVIFVYMDQNNYSFCEALGSQYFLNPFIYKLFFSSKVTTSYLSFVGCDKTPYVSYMAWYILSEFPRCPLTAFVMGDLRITYIIRMNRTIFCLASSIDEEFNALFCIKQLIRVYSPARI